MQQRNEGAGGWGRVVAQRELGQLQDLLDAGSGQAQGLDQRPGPEAVGLQSGDVEPGAAPVPDPHPAALVPGSAARRRVVADVAPAVDLDGFAIACVGGGSQQLGAVLAASLRGGDQPGQQRGQDTCALLHAGLALPADLAHAAHIGFPHRLPAPASRTGDGAAQLAQRAGSSSAHWPMSR